MSADASSIEWVARDGTRVCLRPIDARDLALERALVDGLSLGTGYRRLFSPRHPTAEELTRWTRPEADREAALIATIRVDDREREIGVARYARLRPDDAEAEFAIVIADDWQGKGLGTRLLSALIDVAARSGVRTLFGLTLTENRAMLGMARRLGFRLALMPGDAMTTKVSLALSEGA